MMIDFGSKNKQTSYRFFRRDERSRLLSRLESLRLRRRRDDLNIKILIVKKIPTR